MKIERKHVVASLIALGTITGAYIYLQVQKLKEYCISMNKVKLNDFSANKVDLDVWMNFVNRSKLKINIISQEYLVYLNKSLITKVSNAKAQIINPNSTSILAVKIQFNPKSVFEAAKINATDLIMKKDKIAVNIRANVKVGLGILKFNIGYDYKTNLKELMTTSEPNKSAPKC